VRAAIETARRDLGLSGVQTVLFIDEVHRFSKTQQDALLPAVENRWVSFIGATTENPSFSVVSPLLSRSLLLTLRPLSDADIKVVINRALTDERGLDGRVTLADGVADLVTGYGTTEGGVLSIQRGNLDAFAQQSDASFQAVSRGEFLSPFLPTATTLSISINPDFMAVGHFTGVSSVDLVVASCSGNALYVYPGDGKGSLMTPQVLELP